MASKKPKKQPLSMFERPRLHYCPEHGLEAKPVLVVRGGRARLRFLCPEGCDLRRPQTDKR